MQGISNSWLTGFYPFASRTVGHFEIYKHFDGPLRAVAKPCVIGHLYQNSSPESLIYKGNYLRCLLPSI